MVVVGVVGRKRSETAMLQIHTTFSSLLNIFFQYFDRKNFESNWFDSYNSVMNDKSWQMDTRKVRPNVKRVHYT